MIKLIVDVWGIFSVSEKRRTILIIILMIIGMIMETLGIGLVIPAMALMTNVDVINIYPEIEPVLDLLGNPTKMQLIWFGMLALLITYTIKSIYLGFLSLIQLKFIFQVQESLSLRLFSDYLRQPYSFHLTRNSAQLIQNISAEIALFTQGILNPGMILLTELIVLFGIGILLVAIEPIMALLMILIFSVAVFLFGKITKKWVNFWGRSRQFHDGQRIQHLQQGLGGVKDVKLLGREREFISQFSEHNHMSALVGVRQHFIAGLPRFWLEWLAVFCLVILVFVMLYTGRLLEEIVPTLGFFAASAFRLLPSASKIVAAIQNIRFSIPVLELLNRELSIGCVVNETSTGKLIEFNKSVYINGVSYIYPGSIDKAIDNISININKGESIGIVGPSGSGKSTLIDLLLGLLPPTSGCICVDGRDIAGDLRSWQNHIGYVPQTIYLTDDTIRRNIAFGLEEQKIDEPSIRRAINLAQLDDFVVGLPLGLDTQVGERGVRLSGGQRQRIGIARALYHDPEILVFDEATSALDTETEAEVVSAIRSLQGRKTIVVIAHRLSTVEHLNRVYCIKSGLLVNYGAPFDVLTKGKVF
jgi:ABC-type multidrug transport system fused ATPase/permease subunit